MSDEELPKVSGLAFIFPFVMLLSAMFTTGLVFSAVNVPLLDQVLRDTPNSSLIHIAGTTATFWKDTLPASLGVGVVFLYSLAFLIIGLAIQPVAIVYVTLVGKVVDLLFSIHWKSARFYSPPVFFGSDYVKFSDWIYRHRVEKTHWEWELFNHYIYAGIAFNMLVVAFLTWLLTGCGLWIAFGLGTAVLLSTGYSLARSAVVYKVYKFYSDRAKAE